MRVGSPRLRPTRIIVLPFVERFTEDCQAPSASARSVVGVDLSAPSSSTENVASSQLGVEADAPVPSQADIREIAGAHAESRCLVGLGRQIEIGKTLEF